MSDNFDRKVCDGFLSTKIIQTAVSMTIFTQLSILCRATLATLNANLNFSFFPRLGLNNFWFQIFINFIGSPLYEEFLDIICHGLLYFAILTYINEL